MRNHILRATGDSVYSPTWTMPENDLAYWDFSWTSDSGNADLAYTNLWSYNDKTSMRAKPVTGGGFDNVITRARAYLTKDDFGGVPFEDVIRFEVSFGLLLTAFDLQDPPVAVPGGGCSVRGGLVASGV